VVGFARRRWANWHAVPRWEGAGVWQRLWKIFQAAPLPRHRTLSGFDDRRAHITMPPARQKKKRVRAGSGALFAADDHQNPRRAIDENFTLALHLTPGQAHDGRNFEKLSDRSIPDNVLESAAPTKAYDADRIRERLALDGIQPVIAPIRTRCKKLHYDKAALSRAHRVERFFQQAQTVPPHGDSLRQACETSVPHSISSSLSHHQNREHDLERSPQILWPFFHADGAEEMREVTQRKSLLFLCRHSSLPLRSMVTSLRGTHDPDQRAKPCSGATGCDAASRLPPQRRVLILKTAMELEPRITQMARMERFEMYGWTKIDFSSFARVLVDDRRAERRTHAHFSRCKRRQKFGGPARIEQGERIRIQLGARGTPIQNPVAAVELFAIPSNPSTARQLSAVEWRWIVQEPPGLDRFLVAPGG